MVDITKSEQELQEIKTTIKTLIKERDTKIENIKDKYKPILKEYRGKRQKLDKYIRNYKDRLSAKNKKKQK